jgi:DNA-binding NtrC family response regulator
VSDRRALVAEDSLLILLVLEELLADNNITTVGPAGTVKEAMALAATETFGIAILDVNLGNEMIYPAADILMARGVPIIFTTGYLANAVLPPRYKGQRVIQKPYQLSALMALVDDAFAEALPTP